MTYLSKVYIPIRVRDAPADVQRIHALNGEDNCIYSHPTIKNPPVYATTSPVARKRKIPLWAVTTSMNHPQRKKRTCRRSCMYPTWPFRMWELVLLLSSRNIVEQMVYLCVRSMYPNDRKRSGIRDSPTFQNSVKMKQRRKKNPHKSASNVASHQMLRLCQHMNSSLGTSQKSCNDTYPRTSNYTFGLRHNVKIHKCPIVLMRLILVP